MARKKRTSLDSILPPINVAASDAAERPTAPPETNAETPRSKPKPTRKQLAVHLDSPVYQQLRTIAFEEETKMHPLLLEGLDKVFADRGLPSIAELMAAKEE